MSPLPALPKHIRFVYGPAPHKYTAILPSGKCVRFGNRDYEQYKDRVPRNLGGGRWSHKNHLDKARRTNYRKRHRGVLTANGTPAYLVKYSPSWFSYHFLW